MIRLVHLSLDQCHLLRVGSEVGCKEDRLVGSEDELLFVKAEQLERPLVSQ